MARILIVEDSMVIRALLTAALEDHEIVEAEDGLEGLQIARAEPFDLIVLDLMLPGEDGLSIVRRLRGAGERTPVIMLTARGDDVDRIIGLEVGADDYLTKPFNPRELLARIHAV
ncbi:MAG: response regulator, partial [Gammaproteobacteria bacterium]